MSAGLTNHPAASRHAWSDRPVRPCSCEACAELDLQFPGGGLQLALVLLPPPVSALRPDQMESRA